MFTNFIAYMLNYFLPITKVFCKAPSSDIYLKLGRLNRTERPQGV